MKSLTPVSLEFALLIRSVVHRVVTRYVESGIKGVGSGIKGVGSRIKGVGSGIKMVGSGITTSESGITSHGIGISSFWRDQGTGHKGIKVRLI